MEFLYWIQQNAIWLLVVLAVIASGILLSRDFSRARRFYNHFEAVMFDSLQSPDRYCEQCGRRLFLLDWSIYKYDTLTGEPKSYAGIIGCRNTLKHREAIMLYEKVLSREDLFPPEGASK